MLEGTPSTVDSSAFTIYFDHDSLTSAIIEAFLAIIDVIARLAVIEGVPTSHRRQGGGLPTTQQCEDEDPCILYSTVQKEIRFEG